MKVRVLPLLLAVFLGAGCAAFGPNYRRPATAATGGWSAISGRAGPDREPGPNNHIEDWWRIFGDPTLNRLETAAIAGNPRIDRALAVVNEARAAMGIAAADRWPALSTASVIQVAGALPSQVIPTLNQGYQSRGRSYTFPFNASYELDLWGRVRRSNESASALAEASAADFRGVLLSLTADVAQNYFQLRALEHEAGVVGQMARSRRDEAAVQAARFRGGMATELDVHRAQVEAALLAADLADLTRQRGQSANALAVATGIAPSVFLAPNDSAPLAPPPLVPAGLPAQLLERRPDLVSAEATLHARTADVGVADAQRLPTIALTASAGVASTDLSSLVNRSAQFWNTGASITAPLFDGGRLRSAAEQARARTAEAVAAYRDQVLTALREVEDSLIALRAQAAQSAAQDEAQAEAAIVATLAKTRYDRGLANYLDVTDAERTLLQIERNQAQLLAARYTSTVGLTRALGGAW